MLKKTITYTDYNGTERNEDFYFNLSKAEIAEMELGVDGGLSEKIKKVTSTQNAPQILSIFKDLILKAYGEKSADGRRFIKSAQLRDEFAQTEAYSELFMNLASDSTAAADFVNAIIPAVPKGKAQPPVKH